jgi:hypothetical protein
VLAGKEDFRPKFTTAKELEEKQVKAMDKLVTPPDYSEYIWQT